MLLRSNMTRTVKMNYKGDPKFKKNGWKCQDCYTLDTKDDIVRCLTYQSLRLGKNLSNDKDLVDYFKKVIEIREIEEEVKN